MKLINRSRGEHFLFPHILKTTEPEKFIRAVLDNKYEGMEKWEADDDYEFEETPDVV